MSRIQVRRLGLENQRKTSEPDMGGSSALARSSDCIAQQQRDSVACSSDSDLLRPRRTGLLFPVPASPLPERANEPSTSDSSTSDSDAASLLAKKQKVSYCQNIGLYFSMF